MNKAEKLLKYAKEWTVQYRNDLIFSKNLANARLQYTLSQAAHAPEEKKKKIKKHLDALILKQLAEQIPETLAKYKEDKDEGSYTQDAPIYMFWWQGFDEAPELVKTCVAVCEKRRGNHPLILLDRDNLRDYIELPDFVFDKVEDGTMCLPNFSDYVRVSLLSKHGGLWLDATIFVSKDIPVRYFNRPYYTTKGIPAPLFVSKGRWTGFVMGGWKENVMFRFLKDAYDEYWAKNTVSIDYLILDYFIELAYMNFEVCRDQIVDQGVNNKRILHLYEAMAANEPAERMDEFLEDKTVLYKLSYKTDYALTTEGGEPTLYARFLSEGKGDE